MKWTELKVKDCSLVARENWNYRRHLSTFFQVEYPQSPTLQEKLRYEVKYELKHENYLLWKGRQQNTSHLL